MTNRKLTDIEKILLDILADEGIPYVREYRLGTYNVDAYLPSYKLSIQADGNYFHSYCFKCKIQKKPTDRQLLRIKKDIACIAYHKRYNLSILRFCSCELKDNAKSVKNTILKAISEINKGNLVYRKRRLIEDGKGK